MKPSSPREPSTPHYPDISVSVHRGPIGRLEVRSGDEPVFACTFGQAEIDRIDAPSGLPASEAPCSLGPDRSSKILRDVGAAFGRDLDPASWEAVVASDLLSGSEPTSA